MPDPGEKARVEIEVAIRDMFSTALKGMGRELDNMNKKAQELGQGASSGFNKFRRENDQLNDSTRRSNASLTTMNSIVTGLTNNLVGPVGIVAGFYSAAKSLENFATGRVQLQMFSTDVGFSTQKITTMQRTLADMGQTTEQANQYIAKFGKLLTQVTTEKTGSDLIRLFDAMGAPEMSAKILKNGHDFVKSQKEILEFLKTQSPEFRDYFAEHSGLLASISENYLEMEKKQKIAFEASYQHSAKYLHDMNEITNRLGDLWAMTAEKVILSIASISRALNQNIFEEEKDGGAAKKVRDRLSGAVRKGGGTEEGDSLMPDWLQGLLSNFQSPSDKIKGRWPTKEWPSQDSFKDRFPGSDSFKGQSGDKRSEGTHPGITDFSGRRRDESIQIETDSNKTLREIRDTLQRMEMGIEVPGGTGGSAAAASVSGGSGSGTPRTTFRRGVSSGTGSRGDRNNNPGNLKFGPHAKAFGATHADSGGFAVFPDAASGAAAHETLLKSDSYSGLTLDQFANKYAQGSKSWAKTVGGELGIGGGDIVNNQDPRLAGAIRKAEGTGGGGSGIPSNILAEARAVVAAGGGAEGAKSYIQSKGYNVDSAWCGDFAAAVVTSAGGTPPKNYQVASNWRNFGQPVEGDPQGGDVAVRRSARTGSTGSHVTIVDQFNAESGRFTGIGGNQGRRGMRGNFRQSEYDFFRDTQSARETVDKTQSANQRVDANMNASVDFKNMPSWVKSSVDDNGKFKELKVTRSTPQAGKAEAGNGADSFNSWAY